MPPSPGESTRCCWQSLRSPHIPRHATGARRVGAAVAASVAAVSILWLRGQAPPAGVPLGAHLTPAPLSVAPAAATQGESYVVPVPKPPTVVVPSTELANYVVAHSMFSTPVARRNLLSAFMTSEPAAAGAEEPQGDVKRIAQ